MLKITPLKISGAFLIENDIFNDTRGSFRELMRFSQLSDLTKGLPWTQNNLSISKLNTIRGIHFSKSEVPQNKLVSCVSGKILDFVVDVRPESPTYQKFCEIELTSNLATSVFITGGLGHAFIAKSEDSIVNYLLSSEYNPDTEFGINPFDKKIGIDWGVTEFVISDKDSTAPSLTDAVKFGII
jgi:dTDP-4-dehydrorhamnose 3,5-epimerase